jgi:hypothetical protein
MDPFTMMFIASSAVSAGASVAGGIGASRSSKLNAYNMETQRIQNEAVAVQRANDRYREFKLAESTNRALLSAVSGRDIGGADRSVAAFLQRNRETAFTDIERMESQRAMESMNAQMQAMSERRRGRDALASGVVNAFTTVGSAMMRYDAIK